MALYYAYFKLLLHCYVIDTIIKLPRFLHANVHGKLHRYASLTIITYVYVSCHESHGRLSD